MEVGPVGGASAAEAANLGRLQERPSATPPPEEQQQQQSVQETRSADDRVGGRIDVTA